MWGHQDEDTYIAVFYTYIAVVQPNAATSSIYSSVQYEDTYIAVWGRQDEDTYRSMRTHIQEHEDTYRSMRTQI